MNSGRRPVLAAAPAHLPDRAVERGAHRKPAGTISWYFAPVVPATSAAKTPVFQGSKNFAEKV
jgi:hypothetical protein